MLPVRDGVGASQVSLPAGPWARVLDFLVERFPAVPAHEWQDRMISGDVLDVAGQIVTPTQAYVPHGKLYYYRTVPNEPVNQARATVLYEDELLVVADKPHFLPVTPSGQYLQETLLVRLRRQLNEPELTPIHRIDRETAGIVLFARAPSLCSRYQAIFARREVDKRYEAIAAFDASIRFPLTRSSTLENSDHFMQMREAESALGRVANSTTEIELLETRGAWARYLLRPASGKRHQLRVHMAALGLPILGDRIYPQLLAPGGDEMGNPLRLLAQAIAFKDPWTGAQRSFRSSQELQFPPEPPATRPATTA